MQSQEEEDFLKQDAEEIMRGKPYHWRHWSIVLDEDCLYLWCDVAILELRKDSNGSFRFVLDGNLTTVYFSGTYGTSPDESRRELLKKLLAVQSRMEPGTPSQPILSAPDATRLVVGNWSLFCINVYKISIQNSGNFEETITLYENCPGFKYQSNGTLGKTEFISEYDFDPEFPAGWAKMEEKRFNSKFKLENLKQKENITKPKLGKCSYCKITLNAAILLFHEKDCVYRPTNCPDCSATMLLKYVDNHCCKPAEEYNKVLETELLSKNLKDLFTTENCWDTVLKVANTEFKAHRAILSVRSTVFSAMFQHDTSEKQTGIVNIPDCDPDSFKKFLEYIYCGKLENISSHCALNLYAISDKYNVQELKSFCIKYLTHNITTENICEVVILADAYDETQLFSAIQDYFNENFKKIVITSDWENLLKKNFRLANKLLIEKSKAE